MCRMNTNIALIYEDNINGIPCSLFQVTNIVKKDRKIGVIFTFDVTYNNPQKGNGCCAFEPGVQGTKHKIDSILISFSNESIYFCCGEKACSISSTVYL